MSNTFVEELRRFLNGTAVLTRRAASFAAVFGACGRANVAILTAPKPLLDKALSKGGGG